jgi:hypothetical protein
MAVVTIKLLEPNFMVNFYMTESPSKLARELLDDGHYRGVGIHGLIVADKVGEAAAEEMFDLTNNPNRQEEREEVYGRGRSLSVGDIVSVDGVDYLCCSSGWKVVEAVQ